MWLLDDGLMTQPKLVNMEILELYIKDPELARQQILKDMMPIFTATGDLQKNQFHFTASKPLGEYDKDEYQHEIYLERAEEGLPCGAGTRYSYYKIVLTKVSDGNGGLRLKKFTTHPERYTLDTEKIKEGLINCANIILQLFSIDIRYDPSDANMEKVQVRICKLFGKYFILMIMKY